ncbi:unnamed protein product [Closterium sp. Naga37s-1]|nr:unnamed protein product [Closterium sp. Naga37s-1]
MLPYSPPCSVPPLPPHLSFSRRPPPLCPRPCYEPCTPFQSPFPPHLYPAWAPPQHPFPPVLPALHPSLPGTRQFFPSAPNPYTPCTCPLCLLSPSPDPRHPPLSFPCFTAPPSRALSLLPLSHHQPLNPFITHRKAHASSTTRSLTNYPSPLPFCPLPFPPSWAPPAHPHLPLTSVPAPPLWLHHPSPHPAHPPLHHLPFPTSPAPCHHLPPLLSSSPSPPWSPILSNGLSSAPDRLPLPRPASTPPVPAPRAFQPLFPTPPSIPLLQYPPYSLPPGARPSAIITFHRSPNPLCPLFSSPLLPQLLFSVPSLPSHVLTPRPPTSSPSPSVPPLPSPLAPPAHPHLPSNSAPPLLTSAPPPGSPLATSPLFPRLPCNPPPLPLPFFPQPVPPLIPHPPQATPSHPGLCQGVSTPFDALSSQFQPPTSSPPGMPGGTRAGSVERSSNSPTTSHSQAKKQMETPNPARTPKHTEVGEGRAGGESATNATWKGVREAMGERAAEATRERPAEAVEEGAAKAAGEGAAGAAREGAAEAAGEGAAGVTWEGAAEAAGNGAGGVAREGAAEAAEERVAGAAEDGTGVAGGAAEITASEAAETAAGEAVETATGETAGTTSGEAAGTAAGGAAETTAGEAAGLAAGETAGPAAGENAETAAGGATGTTAGEAAGTAAGEAAEKGAVEAAEEGAAEAAEEGAAGAAEEGAAEAAEEGAAGAAEEGAAEAAEEEAAEAAEEGAAEAVGEEAAEAAGEEAAGAAGEGAAESAGEGAAEAAGVGAAEASAEVAEAPAGATVAPAGAAEDQAGAVEAPEGAAEAPAGAAEATSGAASVGMGAASEVPAVGPGAVGQGTVGTGEKGTGQPKGEVDEVVMTLSGGDGMGDLMLIDGPLAHYLTLTDVDNRDPSLPHGEASPTPPLPNPMLAGGPRKEPEETRKTRHSHVIGGAAKARAFLEEPCSPTPDTQPLPPRQPAPPPPTAVHISGSRQARTTKTRLAADGRREAKAARGQLTYSPLPPFPPRRPSSPHIPLNLHQALPLWANQHTHTPLPFPPLRRAMAEAACVIVVGADERRDAPMADATDSSSHTSHPIQLGSSLPCPMETDLVLRPCHLHPNVVAPPPVQPVTDALPVAQEGTGTGLEVSAPVDTPSPGVAEPPRGPNPAEGEEHTMARSYGSPPHPPSLTTRPVRPGDPTPSSVAPSPPLPTPLLLKVGESSPTLLPGDPLGAQADHRVPCTASSDATAPIDPTNTATSPDQVVRCPTCRSSLANRRALQHHTPFCHPRDAARRAQAVHDTTSILPSLPQLRATGIPFTDALWQTLDSVDWTEYFSPECIHARPLRRVLERVRGGYLDVLSAILARIAQDPEAAGPNFLLAAAPTLFLAPATPPDRSHTAAIAMRISRFGRGEWDELLSDALGRRTPLPRRTGHRSRTATDPSTADERRIARCLRLAACNETSRACAALEHAEATPDTQGTIQCLRSKHPTAERPTPAWLSGFQGSALVLSSFASGEPEQIDRALQTVLEGLPPDVLSLLPSWPSCASASPDSLFAGASRLLEAHALEAGQPVLGEGTWAGGPLEQRGEVGQPGSGGQWGQHQVRDREARGAGGQRGRQGEQTGREGKGGQQRQQQGSQRRPQAQGAAPPGLGSGVGQRREQQGADGGSGGAARSEGED